MDHAAIMRLAYLLPSNPEPGEGDVYAKWDSTCLALAGERQWSEPCACSVHFGHLGAVWVLRKEGQSGWVMFSTESDARIPLGYLGDDPDTAAATVKAALPPRPASPPS